jgi:hypothetical protein
MTRLAEAHSSSDDDLPDLKILLQKPSIRETKKVTMPTVPTTTARTSRVTTNSETKRVRRLGEFKPPTANPLLQKWMSSEKGGMRGRRSKTTSDKLSRETTPTSSFSGSRKDMSSGSDSEEDNATPQFRQQPSRGRNRRIIEDSDDSDDESEKSSGSESGAVLTRSQRLQSTKTSTVIVPNMSSKAQTSRIDLSIKSKALAFAREIDSEADPEEDHEEEDVEEPSVYQTAE